MSDVLEFTFLGLFVLLNKGALPPNDGHMKGAASVIALDTTSQPCGVMPHRLTLRIPSAAVDGPCPGDGGDVCVWNISGHKIAFGKPASAHVDLSDPSVANIGFKGGHGAGRGVNVNATKDHSPVVAARFDLFEGSVKGLPSYKGAGGEGVAFTLRTKAGLDRAKPNPRELSSGIAFRTAATEALDFLPLSPSGIPIVIKLKRAPSIAIEVRNEPDGPEHDPASGDVEVNHFRAYFLLCKRMPPCDEIPVPHFDAGEPRPGIILRPGSPTCPPDQLP